MNDLTKDKPAIEARGGKAPDWDRTRPGKPLPEKQGDEPAPGRG